jgi:hypothetical protein
MSQLGAHGYPRATGDIDIWVKPYNTNSRKLYKVLARFDAPLDQIEIDGTLDMVSYNFKIINGEPQKSFFTRVPNISKEQLDQIVQNAIKKN